MAQPISGESLYSVLARTLAAFGNVADSRFLRVAFGAGGDAAVEFASGIGALIHPWSPTNAERLVTAHTSFNYRAHWLPQRLADRLFRAMVGVRRTVAAIRFQGEGANRTLHFCPQCLDADAALLGVGCWRVHHQLPAVYRCAEHDAPLRASNVVVLGQRRLLACSPGQAGEALHAPFDAPTARRLSRASRALLDEPFVPVTSSALREAFRRKLGEAGWLTRHGMTKRRLPEAIRARYGGECLAALGLRPGTSQSHPIQAVWGWASEPRGPAVWRLLVLDFLQADPLAFLRECRLPHRSTHASPEPGRLANPSPPRATGDATG